MHQKPRQYAFRYWNRQIGKVSRRRMSALRLRERYEGVSIMGDRSHIPVKNMALADGERTAVPYCDIWAHPFVDQARGLMKIANGIFYFNPVFRSLDHSRPMRKISKLTFVPVAKN